MLTYTYISKGNFGLVEKPKPRVLHERDAIVKVTLASICSSDLHIKHGSVPRAVEGITVGHEMVGIVEEVGSAVTHVSPGDRVTVNVETFCGECFFCNKGFVNNCTDRNGGWALGLSDEIQSSAGGIRLDTMFVDEGFGSLDDESLGQAMRALRDLAEGNRLVGIISHVAELKERIDRQIVVTKEKSGGSRVKIRC